MTNRGSEFNHWWDFHHDWQEESSHERGPGCQIHASLRRESRTIGPSLAGVARQGDLRGSSAAVHQQVLHHTGGEQCGRGGC